MSKTDTGPFWETVKLAQNIYLRSFKDTLPTMSPAEAFELAEKFGEESQRRWDALEAARKKRIAEGK